MNRRYPKIFAISTHFKIGYILTIYQAFNISRCILNAVIFTLLVNVLRS